MPDRRTVDELSIEELEWTLMIKRRAARQERMRRLAAQGRLVRGRSLPPEDGSSWSEKEPDLVREATGPRRRGLTVERLGDRSSGGSKREWRVNLRSARDALLLKDLVGDATKGSPDVFVGHHMWHQKTSGTARWLAMVSPCRPHCARRRRSRWRPAP